MIQCERLGYYTELAYFETSKKYKSSVELRNRLYAYHFVTRWHSANGIWNIFCIFLSSTTIWGDLIISGVMGKINWASTSGQPQFCAVLCLCILLVLHPAEPQSTFSPVKYRPWKCWTRVSLEYSQVIRRMVRAPRNLYRNLLFYKSISISSFRRSIDDIHFVFAHCEVGRVDGWCRERIPEDVIAVEIPRRLDGLAFIWIMKGRLGGWG